MVRYIETVETDKVYIQVYECECGFHLGIDGTYLDQVEDVKIECPSCNEIFDTEKAEEDGHEL